MVVQIARKSSAALIKGYAEYVSFVVTSKVIFIVQKGTNNPNRSVSDCGDVQRDVSVLPDITHTHQGGRREIIRI